MRSSERSIRLGCSAIIASTAAAGDWTSGGAKADLAASAQVEAPSMTASIATVASGAVIRATGAGCSANRDATGVSTTSGSSSANISVFLTCESAMCSRPSTSAMRGGESLTPL